MKFIFIISFIFKIFLYYYLSKKNNTGVNISGVGASIEVFWFYTKKVPDKFSAIKYLCNSLQIIWMSTIFLWAILQNLHQN